MRSTLLIALVGLVFGCQRAEKKPPELESKDILARTQPADSVDVKHVLIGWKDLAGAYGGRMEVRAQNRTQAEAEKLARDIASQLRKQPDRIGELMKQHSDDPGSAQNGQSYPVTADSGMVPEFKNLALRLAPNEVGTVKSQFGYHVMLRVPPAPPDPLESADIMSRPAPAENVTAHIQHVLVSWQDAPGARDPRAKARTKQQADQLAKEILDKVRAGDDMAGLMKAHSEDPGSKDDARVYPVTKGSGMIDPFERMSLRLKEGEAGLVKTPFGWHVMKRVAAPPPPPPPAPEVPDRLDSADILKREPKTDNAHVKHILIGWKEVNSGDPRATTRERKDLEKLVKDTVAKLKKGAKIEALMAELSEDPGSAKAGTGYDVTPTASLVEPFKQLALRLDLKEVGVVKSRFGIHVIQRVEPPGEPPPPPPSSKPAAGG